MKKLIVMFSIIILLFPSIVFAEKFDYEKTFVNVLLVTDWAQTRYISRNTDKFHERNLILGRYPSTTKVDTYFLTVILAYNVIEPMLSDKYSKYLTRTLEVIQIESVANNLSLNIKIRF